MYAVSGTLVKTGLESTASSKCGSLALVWLLKVCSARIFANTPGLTFGS